MRYKLRIKKCKCTEGSFGKCVILGIYLLINWEVLTKDQGILQTVAGPTRLDKYMYAMPHQYNNLQHRIQLTAEDSKVINSWSALS